MYKFIRDKIRGRGYGPTVREIAEQFDINSPNGVVCHLKALVKKGLIIREPNMSRAIQLAAEPIEERGLPLAGRIAAGVLHEAIEQNERVDFEAMFNPDKKNLFVLAGQRRVDDRGPDRRRRLRGGAKAAHRPEGPDRRRPDRRGRGHAEALVPREEPHPPEAGQLEDEAHLRKNARVLGVVVGVVRKVG